MKRVEQEGPRPLGTHHRVRLVIALVVLAALGVMCLIGIGTQLHLWSETHDSLAHWRARLADEDASAPGGRTTGFDSPAVRIRQLESELDAIPERLLPMGLLLALSCVLTFLGWRALKRSRAAGG